MKQSVKKYISIGTFLLFSTVCLFVVVQYVTHERTIYFFDRAFYFNYFRDQAITLSKVVESFGYTYTYVPLIPLVIFRFVFGDSRLTYIVSISILYGLAGLAIFCDGCMGSDRKISITGIVCFIIVLFFNPQFWHAIVFGYPDVGGVFIAGTILILSKKNSDVSISSLGRQIIIGILLALLIIFRRYYAHWAIGYLCASGVLFFPKYYSSAKHKLVQLGFLLIPVGICITVLYFSLGKSFSMLFQSYGDMYSAYKITNSFEGLVRSFLWYYGGFWSILILFTFIIQGIHRLFDKKNIFLFIVTFLPITLLSTIQDPGLQHWYILFPGLIFSIYRSIQILDTRIRSLLKRVACFLFSVLVVLVFFISATGTNMGVLNGLFPSRRLIPEHRSDISYIHGMLEKLDKRAAHLSKPTIYVLSSSDILNYSLVQEAAKQFGFFRLLPGILVTPILDKRDSFPWELFEANYILVPNEHYSGFAHPQFVVDGLVKLFLDDTSLIAPYYQRLDTKYILKYNTTVNIFYRQRVIPNEVVNLLYIRWEEAKKAVY